jgi:hypothetical protein
MTTYFSGRHNLYQFGSLIMLPRLALLVAGFGYGWWTTPHHGRDVASAPFRDASVKSELVFQPENGTSGNWYLADKVVAEPARFDVDNDLDIVFINNKNVPKGHGSITSESP